MSNTKKNKRPVAQVVFILLTVASVGLLVGGFFAPPMGKIDGSVLQGAGILLGFSALWVAAHTIIEVYHDGKIAATAKIGDASLSINAEDGDNHNAETK